MNDDSYVGGMFATKSDANLMRSIKRKRQRNVVGIAFGEGLRRPRIAKPKAPKVDRRKHPPSPKRDQLAELLSEHDLATGYEGGDIAECAARMGITLKAARRHFETIRKRLGPQAV